MSKGNSSRHSFIRFLFVVYGLAMLWLLFGRPQGWVDGLTYKEMLQQNVNLTPLLTIKNYWQVVQHSSNPDLLRHCLINLAGNVVLFIPIGYWLVRLWPRFRNFFLFAATCAGMILLIETLQLFTLLGCFDVDDIILNLSGMTVGYFLCLLFHHKKSRF